MKVTNKFISLFTLILSMTSGVNTIQGSCRDNAATYQETCRIDRVIIHEQGIVLLVDNFWIGAQAMQATPDGIILLENGEWIALAEAIQRDNYYVWQCRKCLTYNPQGTNTCFNCKQPR